MRSMITTSVVFVLSGFVAYGSFLAASQERTDYSDNYYVMALAGHQLIASGEMTLDFSEAGPLDEDQEQVLGRWKIECNVAGLEMCPSGTGEVRGRYGLISRILSLTLDGHRWPPELVFEGVLHAEDWPPTEAFKVFRGTWTFSTPPGKGTPELRTYGGLMQVSDREEPRQTERNEP